MKTTHETKWQVQHEFDEDPTYIVHSDDEDLRYCVEIPAVPNILPIAKRLELARLIADYLNQHARVLP